MRSSADGEIFGRTILESSIKQWSRQRGGDRVTSGGAVSEVLVWLKVMGVIGRPVVRWLVSRPSV